MVLNYNPIQTSLSNFRDKIEKPYNRAADFILAPQANYGIKNSTQSFPYGLVFHVISGIEINKSSDITDHYSEDGRTINDSSIKKPVEIKLRGYVSEIYYTPSFLTFFANTTAVVSDKLQIISSLVPSFPSAVNSAIVDIGVTAQNIVNTVYGVVTAADDIFNSFKKKIPLATEQQKVYQYLTALFDNNILLDIITPWGIINSMILRDFVSTQGEDSNLVSGFELELKEFRTVEVKTVQFDFANYKNKAQPQIVNPVNQGKKEGIKITAENNPTVIQGVLYGRT